MAARRRQPRSRKTQQPRAKHWLSLYPDRGVTPLRHTERTAKFRPACDSAQKWDPFQLWANTLVSLQKRASWWVPIDADRDLTETGIHLAKASPLIRARVSGPPSLPKHNHREATH